MTNGFNFIDELQMVSEWLEISKNAERIPTIGYSKEVYNFIENSASKISNGNGEFYKLYENWFKMKLIE